ncbi:hypothetical protein AGMMS50230_22470 [Spirochaetia bacterium]|nr:hypothetical protein AGMMS50230_22470 [Spirochaetia bacterium]
MGMVSYTPKTMPPASQEEWDRVAAIKDEEIDYSDIPPLDTLSLRSRPSVDRGMYRPIKVAVTCKLDADVLAWLKQGGKGYQTRLNSILRQVMVHAQ